MIDQHSSGWFLSESIALEIDTALSIAGGYLSPQDYPVPETFFPLIESLTDEWYSGWNEFFGSSISMVSLLSTLALATGNFTENNYSTLTLRLREMSSTQLLSHLIEQEDPGEVQLNPLSSPEEQLCDLLIHIKLMAYAKIGLPELRKSQIKRSRQSLEKITHILKNGDLNARFWHWLDRFYYQSYEPWRNTRQSFLEERKKQALAVLGATTSNEPPQIGWLPPQNPVQCIPEIHTTVTAAQVRLFFWLEPFGLMDTWAIWSNLIIVSFAEPGELYENFRAYASDIGSRTKALADPTRLLILRIIRHFGMINTDIASFLGLARPTVSVHVKILQEAGLIRSYKSGREMKHEIVPEEVHRLFTDLKTFLDLPENDDYPPLI